MIDLVIAVGTTVFSNAIQIAGGSIIAVFMLIFDKKKVGLLCENRLTTFFLIIVSAFFGFVIPLGTYGLIPIVAVLLTLKIKGEIIVPLIFSNAFFNMLVPYTDPTFVWKTGIKRVILALVISILSGITVRFLMKKETDIFNTRIAESIQESYEWRKSIAVVLGNSINICGSYLIIGSILDAIFHRYLRSYVMDFIFTNPHTSIIPRFFAGLNVADPLFLLTMTIITMFLDLAKMSAILAIFRVKGFAYFVGIYLCCAVLLGLSAII